MTEDKNAIYEMKVPVPDQTTEEVMLVTWHKKEGDMIQRGDIVLEIETDKATLEVESFGSGVLLKCLADEGATVPVGSVVALLGPAGMDVDDYVVKPRPSATTATPRIAENPKTIPDSSSTRSGAVKASPNARRLARELSVDLREVTGSGRAGRIEGEDVQRHADGPADRGYPGKRVPLSKMRRAIGLNLQRSVLERPHFSVVMTVDMSAALALREKLNQSRSDEKRISVNDLIVDACAKALDQYPAVSSRLEEDSIVYPEHINIGVATAVEEGLVVPVLLKADQLSLEDISDAAKRLSGEAREGRIMNAGKGTFTVSNLGMFGVESFTAIVNPPESAILAVGAIRREVVEREGSIGVRPMMTLTLCSDHRLVDGAVAARFLAAVKARLEASNDRSH